MNYKLEGSVARRYTNQKKEFGVHTPHFVTPGKKDTYGQSYAGYLSHGSSFGVASNDIVGARPSVDKRGNFITQQVTKAEMQESARVAHEIILKEIKGLKKPNLP